MKVIKIEQVFNQSLFFLHSAKTVWWTLVQ